jgi:peroxiredoxin
MWKMETRTVCRVAVLVWVMTAAAMSGHAQSRKAPGASAIGIEPGTKAPGFALPDQFGHQQTNQTLRGTNGTVLLFFRSADW